MASLGVSIELIWCSVRTPHSNPSELKCFPTLCELCQLHLYLSSVQSHSPYAGHISVHPKTQRDPMQIPEPLSCLDLSCQVVYLHKVWLLQPPQSTVLSPQLNETAILCRSPLSSLGSSKCLQAGSQVDYRAHVICLASLWDHIATLPVVQYLQIVISCFFPWFSTCLQQEGSSSANGSVVSGSASLLISIRITELSDCFDIM